MADDPYMFLSPCSPGAKAFCNCQDKTPAWLGREVWHNPVHCLVCGMPVRPEDVPVPESLAGRLSQRSRVYSALVELSVDIDGHDLLASAELHDIRSRVNQDGLWPRQMLSDNRPCFFWHIRPETMAVESCPNCSRPTRPYIGGFCRIQVCESCGIVMAGRI